MGSLNPTNTNISLPIINISPTNPSAPAQLLSAASQYGFVFIENTPDIGIPPAQIAHLFELSQTFFAAPTEVKERVSIASNVAGKNHGWLSRGVETLDPGVQVRADVKEAFNIGEPINGKLQQPLPTPLQPHASDIIAFQSACHTFCLTLFRQFARALALPDEEWFTSRHDSTCGQSGTVLRLLYYPCTPEYEADIDIRAGAHSDFGSVTLLFQLPGQTGLEIRTQGGDWAGVPVDPSRQPPPPSITDQPLPILINFGDLLEDWTGGLFKSTVHRVVFPPGGGEQRDRYSIAYFCHPLDEARLEAVPSAVVEEFAARTGKTGSRGGKVLTARDHLMERLASTYTIAR